MNIRVTIEQETTRVSVIADEKMRIKDVINRLEAQGYLEGYADAFMRSVVQERVISTENTFEEERIKTGDKITDVNSQGQ